MCIRDRHEGVSLIGKLVTLVTMWLGARLVMDLSLIHISEPTRPY